MTEDGLNGSAESPHSYLRISRRTRSVTILVMARAEEKEAWPPRDWLEEFEAAARRPLETRMRYAFLHTYKPVLDDAGYRAFDTMEDYRRWCEEKLPAWLGYGRI